MNPVTGGAAASMNSVTDGAAMNVHPIVCLGDSIAASGWPEALEKLMRGRGWQDIHVFNAGVRGNTSTQGLKRLEQDVIARKPGIVFIQFGFNDCNVILNGPRPRTQPARFGDNLKTLVDRIRKQSAAPILIANHSTLVTRVLPDGRSYEQHSQEYSAITAAVAGQTGTPLLDMRRRFPGSGVSLREALAEDGIHLSAAGIDCYARIVADYLVAAS
ncbi:MAG TPA: SGNH/GDSL hydrolase family protein [Armatimonadota bacterium]|nr:SGNH/GDSL hydrolase family protein [Armatimonadota bacterium]